MAKSKVVDTAPVWQVPDYIKCLSKPEIVAGWVDELLQDREALLKSTSQYKDIDKAFSLIAGQPDSSINEQRSNMNTNRAKRSIREINAALSDVRQMDGFDTEDKAFKPEAAMLNKVMKALWYERSFDRSMKRTVQWFTAAGTASQWPVYRKIRMGPGSQSALCFDAYGLLDVFPYGRAFDNEPQNTYATIIVKPLPMPQAHSMFPAFQHRIKSMSKKRYDSSVANKRMSLADMFRARTTGSSRAYEGDYAELRMVLVRDMKINTTGLPIFMGSQGGSESYWVPFIGQEIPTSDVVNGQRKMRQAGVEDCYLFPHMRLIMCFDGLNVPVYDNTNFDWSGYMPAEYSADLWPWERIGYSLVRDIYELERARQHGERAIDQVIRHRMDPSIGYDSTKLTTKEAEGFDPWRERGRLGFNGDVDDVAYRTLIPPQLLEIPPAAFQWQQYCSDEEDYLLGLNQISAMARAKVGVDGDAMQQLLELAGPLVKDISRTMEPPTRDVMEITKYNIFQWYTTRDLMTYVGPDGITPVTFDFDPSKLYPSHMPGEDTDSASAFSARERAKNFAQNLKLTLTPNTLHAVTQTAQKLLYLQLWRSGFPMSPVTVAKALDLENFGTIEGNTQLEQFYNWKKQEIEMAAQAQQLAASELPQAAPPMTGPTPAGSQHGTGGRPPQGNQTPQLQTKTGPNGPRAVISESG